MAKSTLGDEVEKILHEKLTAIEMRILKALSDARQDERRQLGELLKKRRQAKTTWEWLDKDIEQLCEGKFPEEKRGEGAQQ